MPESLELNPSSFMLRDRDFGVAYEGFVLNDICNGSVIEVRDAVLEGEAEAAAAEARSLQADLQIGPSSYFTVSAKSGRASKKALSEFSTSTVSTVGTTMSEEGDEGEGEKVDEYLQREALLWAKKMLGHGELHLTPREKLWQFLDEPGSSRAAMMFTMAMLTLIVFSTVTFCLETLPAFYEHEPKTTSVWFIMVGGALDVRVRRRPFKYPTVGTAPPVPPLLPAEFGVFTHS